MRQGRIETFDRMAIRMLLGQILLTKPRLWSPAGFLINFGDGEAVINQMTEPHRTYHNLSHAMDLALQAYDLYLAERPLTTQLWEDMLFYYLSAFYHDIIYIPGSKENEINSADQFFSTFNGLLSASPALKGVIEDVIVCIRLSANHFAPEAYTANERISRFLDLDLLGLSAGWDEYWLNNQKIRLEYRNSNDQDWANGRANWIDSALKVPQLYRQMPDREPLARKNLEVEAMRYKS